MKKILKYTLVLIMFLGLLFSFSLYFIGNGVKSDMEYCSKFIPDLEAYYAKSNHYPETLMAFGGKAHFNFRYTANSCGYERLKKGYIFSVSHGLGFKNYESWTEEWRND